jgi:hypothetical protein
MLKQPMSSRIEYILNIGNGAMILPFLNRPTLRILSLVSKDIRDVCKRGAYHVMFYGIPLTTLMPGSVFHDLFYGEYEELEKKLIKNEDRHIDSPYEIFDVETQQHAPSMYRAMIINYPWNGLVLMEIAYMNADEKGIELLAKYKRTVAHTEKSRSSSYGIRSINLLREYHEPAILDRISETKVSNVIKRI